MAGRSRDGASLGVVALCGTLSLSLLFSLMPCVIGVSYLPPRRRHRLFGTQAAAERGPEVPADPLVKEDWYPQFPDCEKLPVSLLDYPTGPRKKSPCVQLPLPPETARFANTQAPPQRPAVNNSTNPGYLFILGTAYGGTTPLLGLLSSSPKVAIPEAGWGHEGHWQLVHHNTFPFMKRSGLSYTKAMSVWEDLRYDKTVDIEAVARDLESSWNPSFPIRVDKSHFLVTVADRLYPFYRARGSVVKFIVLVRHPCTYREQGRRMKQHLQKMLEFKRFLEDHPDDALLVQYEEFVRDPDGTAQKILRFYPELEILDPKVSKLEAKSTTLPTGNGDRGMATGGKDNAALYQKYVTDKMEKVGHMGQFHRTWCEGFPASRKEILQEEGLDILRSFGWLAPKPKWSPSPDL